jgi:uncharacterized protein YrrD
MLLHGSRLIGIPVMSLQTGTSLATTTKPVIDPSNLKIVAYELQGPMLSDNPSFIRIADVRELSDIGMIVDSSDEFIGIDDVISLQEIYNLHFELIGLSVVDEAHHKLGRVNSYNIDSGSFSIQQLNVKRGMIKSLADTELLIHRSQIIEINDTSVIVRTTAKKLSAVDTTKQIAYLNPFRTTNPQTNNKNT